VCSDSRFQHAFTECVCVFKVITLVWANHGNYFENAIACVKRTLKTTVATQLEVSDVIYLFYYLWNLLRTAKSYFFPTWEKENEVCFLSPFNLALNWNDCWKFLIIFFCSDYNDEAKSQEVMAYFLRKQIQGFFSEEKWIFLMQQQQQQIHHKTKVNRKCSCG